MTTPAGDAGARATAARKSLPGVELHLPGDPGYNALREPWNLTSEQRPAAIAVPRTTAQVAEVVVAAQSAGLRVAAQTTGHGATFLRSTLEDAILLRMHALTGVTVDPAGPTARLRGGSLWRDVVEVVGTHELAAMHGGSLGVGVTGYLMSGGISWYGRAHGLASNKIRAIELVLPDGRFVRADATHEPELFWALRGGGAAFGVVTTVETKLLRVRHTYAGTMLWDAKDADRAVHGWADWTRTAPESATTTLRMMNFPPVPALPEHLRGRRVVVVDGVVVGDQAEEAVAGLRALRPEADTFSYLPAAAIGTINLDPPGPTPVINGHAVLKDFPEAAVDSLLDVAGPQSGTCLRAAEIRHLGGALARPDVSGGAINHVSGPYALFGLGVGPTPETAEAARSDVAKLVDALAPYRCEHELSNFSDLPDASRSFPPDVLAKLRGIRSAVDPGRTLVTGDWLGD